MPFSPFMSIGKIFPFRFFMWKFCCASGAGEKCGCCCCEGTKPKCCFIAQTEKRSGPLPYPAHHIRGSCHCCYVRRQTWSQPLLFFYMPPHLFVFLSCKTFTETTVSSAKSELHGKNKYYDHITTFTYTKRVILLKSANQEPGKQ